jgi:preprotein translocase subunit YajC
MGMMVMGVLVVMVVMMMRSQRRAGKHHQEQYSGKKSLHAQNVTRARRQR